MEQSSYDNLDLLEIIQNLKTDWKYIIFVDKNKEILNKINEYIVTDSIKFSNFQRIFPLPQYIFNAFNYFNFKDTKIVCIGQDCYHGYGQANGLCFSVNYNIKIPPSLKNIFKELNTDINFEIPKHGNLEKWAEQGILLLNSSLTVRETVPNSHTSMWEPLTDNIISYISNNSNNIIFILWGNYAKKKKKIIDVNKHFILEANHPSPLSANRPGWFGNKHFSQSNKLLKSINKDEINWQI
jgi:uracil-DNA glycosylase